MTWSVTAPPKTEIVMLKLQGLSEEMKEGMIAGFDELGSNLVRTGENQALNEPKFGRTYKIRNKRGVTKLHRASAPGQSPALLSGNYFSEFKYETHGWQSLEFGNDAEYSEFLEFGTKRAKTGRGRWRLAPRPGVRNAVKANVRNARTILETNIGNNFKL